MFVQHNNGPVGCSESQILITGTLHKTVALNESMSVYTQNKIIV